MYTGIFSLLGIVRMASAFRLFAFMNPNVHGAVKGLVLANKKHPDFACYVTSVKSRIFRSVIVIP